MSKDQASAKLGFADHLPGVAMLRFIAAAALTVLLPLGLVVGSVGQDKVALVIGNAAYDHVSTLNNPANDANDIAAALERIGFSVTLAVDLGGTAMRDALHQFSGVASQADTALVYYAGHGIEIEQQNYLIPIDAALASDRDVSFEAVPLELVSEAVSGAKSLRIILLDACRNNPFAAQMTLSAPNRSAGQGLAVPEPSGGTLIAYSAKGGTVANDGAGRNSPFAKALLANLEQPGLEINFLFRRVRDAVLAETEARQEPFIYGSLPSQYIYLVPPSASVDMPAEASADETAAWQLAQGSGKPEAVREFVYTYPRGFYVETALQYLRALEQTEAREAELASVAIPEPAPQPPSLPAGPDPVIVGIQQALRTAKCAPGPADGLWGGQTVAALQRFASVAGAAPPSAQPDLLAWLQQRSGIRCAEAVAANTPAVVVTAPVARTVPTLNTGCYRAYQDWANRPTPKAFYATEDGDYCWATWDQRSVSMARASAERQCNALHKGTCREIDFAE